MSARRVDRDRLRRKIQFIRDRLRSVETIRGAGRDAFIADEVLQAAAVRNLQVMIEAVLDVVHHVVAQEGLGVPGTYHEALDLVIRAGILEEQDGPTLHKMIGFRNRAVHLYDELDPTRVFALLADHPADFEKFIAAIATRYLSGDPDG